MTEYKSDPDYQKAVYLTNEIRALANLTCMRFGTFLNPTQTYINIALVKDSLDLLRQKYEEYLVLLNEYVTDK